MESLRAFEAGLQHILVHKPPFISTITAAYTVHESKRVEYSALQDFVTDATSEFYRTFTATTKNVLTKVKSQLHIPLPAKVQDCPLCFRVRYIVYTKKGTKRSNFLNQLCFYYTLPSGKRRCFKVFCNGVVHVTGYNDLDEMDACVSEFYETLHHLVSGTRRDYQGISRHVEITNADSHRVLHMMNMATKLRCQFYLSVASLHLSKHTPWTISYEPELYSAMMVNSGHFKANIFSTGSIIITGVKSAPELCVAYREILETLDAHFADITTQAS